MNLAKLYPVLLKHLDKPECFLENTLFREYLRAFQTGELVAQSPSISNGLQVKGLRVSLLETEFLSAIQQTRN
jgi:hypothetical protein